MKVERASVGDVCQEVGKREGLRLLKCVCMSGGVRRSDGLV